MKKYLSLVLSCNGKSLCMGVSAEGQRYSLGITKVEGLESSELEVSTTDNALVDGTHVDKKDFDLGDICTYVNTEIGVMTEKRITEITETYEGSGMALDVTFGDDEAATIKQLINKGV